jgi:hypothetical protein
MTGACQPHHPSLAKPALCAPFAAPDSPNPESLTPKKQTNKQAFTGHSKNEKRNGDTRNRTGIGTVLKTGCSSTTSRAAITPEMSQINFSKFSKFERFLLTMSPLQ